MACSCIRTEFGKRDYDKPMKIVTGKVVAVKIDQVKRQKVITLKVHRTLKGTHQKNIELRTPISSASCGVGVSKGDKWLFFVYDFENSNHISLCSKHVRYNRRPKQDRKSFVANRKKLSRYIKKIKSYQNGR